MLNDRIAASAIESKSAEPASSSPSDALRQLADFLAGVPGLPELYITMSDNARVGLQLPTHEPVEPQDRFPALARLAQAMGSDTHLNAWSRGGWVFETHGAVGGLHIHAYAPFNDDEVVPAGGTQDGQADA
ncbi:hypothetical protein [Streptomyces sp. STR69]|uniref:hypothetical protein n=1 Tax=Streptomyces sp. STR69 TaxID=1796942 RepID=UPI0021C60059|nr:hypothetical protein [Streptomyces sp. STR69]